MIINRKNSFQIAVYFFIGLFSQTIIGQSTLPKQKEDSLLYVWSNAKVKPSEKFNALYRLTWDGYLFSKPDTTIILGTTLESYAQKEQLKSELGKSLNLQGIAHSRMGAQDIALEKYLACVNIRSELDDKKGVASVMGNIGIIYSDKGMLLEAIETYEKALKLKTEIKDWKGVSLTKNNIGNIYFQLNDNEKAIKYYEECIKINDSIGLQNLNYKVYINLGSAHQQSGSFYTATQYYDKFFEDFGEQQDDKANASTYNNLGLLYYSQGNYEKANESFEKSLLLNKTAQSKKGIATVMMNQALLFLKQNDVTKAQTYFEEALLIAKEIEDYKIQANTYNNLGLISQNQGKIPKAIKYFQKCLDIEVFQNNTKGQVGTIANKGQAYLMEDNIKLGKSLLINSLEIAEKNEFKNEIKSISSYLFIQYSKEKNIDSAYLYLNKILEETNSSLKRNYFSLSEYEKELYFKTLTNDYSLYFDFIYQYPNLKENATEIAYDIALKIKGLNLKSTSNMRKTILASKDSTVISNYEKWITLKKQIVKEIENGNDIKLLSEKANKLEVELIQNSQTFSEFNKQKSIDWKTVQKSLKENEVAIEFIDFYSTDNNNIKTKKYGALLIKKSSLQPEFIALCDEVEILEILGNVQANNLSFVNAIYGTKKNLNSDLYNKIWLPIDAYLKGIEKIYYAPSGLLHKVAFASISSSEKKKYLSDRYTLVQTGSTVNLVHQEKKYYSNSANVLIMGGVTYTSNKNTSNEKDFDEVWSYLPGTLDETNSIVNLLKTENENIAFFSEHEANETNFKKHIENSKYIHISTHGFFFPDPDLIIAEVEKEVITDVEINFRGTSNYAQWNFVKSKNPLMRSGFVLAGANDSWNNVKSIQTEDGILTSLEISNLDLQNLELAVLSACETGLGDIQGSEGVFGLQRAFKMAGAKNLIMSLWQVPDKETAEFMKYFYSFLSQKKTINEAFLLSQEKMRKKYDPFYWAAFVLIN
jgi:CHAT domain-containing protein